MPKAAPSAPAAWLGAPPVLQDGFAFANGDFYAQASGSNRHRRATLAELKTHFTSGNDKDHPAHWFEAQLVHYGLPPSKNKSVARMRLLDAVNAGGLAIPASISKIEAALKKEWNKNDREAKRASASGPAPKKTASAAPAAVKPVKAGKRSAGDDQTSSTPAPAKKAKTDTVASRAKPTTATATSATKAKAKQN
jgi:hypothetical protein